VSYVSVYVPTTPNPTSGFFLMMPASDVIELDMTVDEALKYIISMGVVAPPPHPESSPTLESTGKFHAYPLLRTTQRRPRRADRHPVRLGSSSP
jgi:uncharacterized membrane protein